MAFTLLVQNQRRLACRFAVNGSNATTPTVLFLPGFRSVMNSQKCWFVEQLCRENKWNSACFDYSGHGESCDTLRFEECNISIWMEDAMAVLKHTASDRVVLVGSSMGGWIAHLVAMRCEQQVCGIVTVGCAVDFTEELIWNCFTPAQCKLLNDTGRAQLHSEYSSTKTIITRNLIEDARKHLLLSQKQTALPKDIPLRYIHGMADVDVPWSFSTRLAESMQSSSNVQVILDKQGDHRFSSIRELAVLGRMLKECVSEATF